jgi:RNA polymerase sigma factor (sigma-70 family)
MDRPDGYLYRVAMNAFRKRWRRTRLDVRLRARAEDARDPFERTAEKDEVARALAVLPRRERAALVLTELLDLDSKETGELLGIKPATVRVLTHRARQRVRNAMGIDDE